LGYSVGADDNDGTVVGAVLVVGDAERLGASDGTVLVVGAEEIDG
jgi:hypothetical protein